MRGTVFDPAARTRARLRALETRSRDRAEAAAVAEGVAETMGLSEARGAVFERPPSPGRPYRRQTGLDWLARKGRISPAQKSAGERYGALYRRTAREEVLLMAAEDSAQAAARLAALRARLWDQADLISACDLVCGQELTPREAVASEREVGRIEALVVVALDVLAGGGG